MGHVTVLTDEIKRDLVNINNLISWN
jgi:hypothetical protein